MPPCRPHTIATRVGTFYILYIVDVDEENLSLNKRDWYL
jgi:hypothetical protein